MKTINIIKIITAILDPTGTTNTLINAGERTAYLIKEEKEKYDEREEKMVKDELRKIGF